MARRLSKAEWSKTLYFGSELELAQYHRASLHLTVVYSIDCLIRSSHRLSGISRLTLTDLNLYRLKRSKKRSWRRRSSKRTLHLFDIRDS
ncbi:hypothetical protein J6590_082093 [Homalodisca vitripennis]|nr:hypothetical protein J6590_082093 [Homalodisca vitripennis]